MNEDQQYEQLKRDYQGTFGTAEGKRVLDDLIKRSTIKVSSISPDKKTPIDTNRLVYDEGQRALILYIQWMLEEKTHDERPKTAKD